MRKYYGMPTKGKQARADCAVRTLAWEAWAVGATHDDIKRLKDQGYVVEHGMLNKMVLYVLTEKGKKRVGKNQCRNRSLLPTIR